MAGEVKYSPTNMEHLGYRQENWHTIINRNFEITNYHLSKVECLLDVDADGKLNNSLLMWNSIIGKWIPANF